MPVKYGQDLYCTQGQGGSFSHQGNHYYAFDFNKADWRNSSSNFAYGVELYSPINGTIVDLRNGLPDFSNNSGFNEENYHGWGNTMLILDEGGEYAVRIAHLRDGSTDHLSENDDVTMGQFIGEIGQTGFSTSPHLHIEVRRVKPWISKPSTMDDIETTSSPFTFVEGHVGYGDWVESAQSYNMSVLDNNEETSLSSRFGAHNFVDYFPWEWDCGDYEPGATGKDFCMHYVQSANDQTRFTWQFMVKQSAVYGIFATYPTKAYHYDPNAEYSINGKVARYRTQESAGPFYKFIGVKYLAAGQYHTVSVRGTTPGRDVIADALVLRRFGG